MKNRSADPSYHAPSCALSIVISMAIISCFFSFDSCYQSCTCNMSEDRNSRNCDDIESRPLTPTADDCCGNSCNPCIFDVHERLIRQWEEGKNRSNKNERRKNVLNPLSYEIFVVTEVKEIAEEFVKIQLDCKKRIDRDSRIFLRPGQHIILSIKDKKSGSYTPISWTSDSLELLIKIYPNGVLTQNLRRLKIGEEIRVRGPYGDFEYKRNSFRDIVAFCIGSGIAAIYPIIKAIVDDEYDETRFNLVAGFRKITEIPLKKELRLVSDYWNVKCTLQISTPTNEEIFPCGMEIQRGRINEYTINRTLANYSPRDTLILVCGTPEFNDMLEGVIKNDNFLNYHVFS